MASATICNVCGKTFDMWDLKEMFGIHQSEIGYGSSHDGETISIDLCCTCFDELMDYVLPKCKIDPVEALD